MSIEAHGCYSGIMRGIYRSNFLIASIAFMKQIVFETQDFFVLFHMHTGRALFNPRIEYNSNQWIPVGHSDPLKNDPTFDYSPPTLDRVRYWHETNDDNNNSVAANYNLDEKSEILLLGVPIVHTMYPKNVHHTNSNAQDPKANNRRSSTYYPPEVRNPNSFRIFRIPIFLI